MTPGRSISRQVDPRGIAGNGTRMGGKDIVVRLDAAMFTEVRALADGSGESLASTVRTLIRTGLDNLDPAGPLKVAL